MPHWLEWTRLCTQLCSFWQGHFPEARPERETRFPRLVDGWRVVGRTKRPGPGPWLDLLVGLRGQQGAATGANDAVWKLRNDRAHRMATRTTDRREDEALLARYAALVEAAAAELFGERCLAAALRSADLRDQLRAASDLRFEAEPPGRGGPVCSGTGIAACRADRACRSTSYACRQTRRPKPTRWVSVGWSSRSACWTG